MLTRLKYFVTFLRITYWFRVEGWNNYGASEVVDGVDESVIMWLNSPSSPGK